MYSNCSATTAHAAIAHAATAHAASAHVAIAHAAFAHVATAHAASARVATAHAASAHVATAAISKLVYVRHFYSSSHSTAQCRKACAVTAGTTGTEPATKSVARNCTYGAEKHLSRANTRKLSESNRRCTCKKAQVHVYSDSELSVIYIVEFVVNFAIFDETFAPSLTIT